MTRCEIDGCEHTATQTLSGIAVCDRCGREWVSVGIGATYWGGSWRRVRGAQYTPEQAQAFPGLHHRPGLKAVTP
jgi:hypothetical protein